MNDPRPPTAAWSLTTATDTSAPGCDLVRQWLREHNWAANPAFMQKLQQPVHAAQPLILLTHANGETIGGLFAETQLSWLRISIMSVHPEWRSKGIGTALLAEAERLALERGCKHAYVDTMDYQAPRFYLSHGYEIVGQIPDWDSHCHSKMYFSKPLDLMPHRVDQKAERSECCSCGLTTQAQRPGPQRRPIATWPRWPVSLQGMVGLVGEFRRITEDHDHEL